jgi:Spy/CpxP family protein refolding chaperone
MMNLNGRVKRTATITGLTATALILLFSMGASSAWAERGMDCHSGMGMSGHGHGHGMGMMAGGMGMHGMHGMHPHNAAKHFLDMGPALNLTDAQIKKLTTLRDQYIDKNAMAEQQLKAAYDDLGRALYGDSVDMDTVNALLAKIGKLDGQLWHAYAQQLHDIKAMLTPDQKQALNNMWHHGMHGGMPMPHHHKPMGKGMGMGM